MEFRNYKDSIQLLKPKSTANCNDYLCKSPFVKYVLPSFLIVLVILTSVYFGLITWLPQKDPDSKATCRLQPSYYVSCAPARATITRDECLELGCCWRDDLNLCYHAFPSRYGYKMHAYRQTKDLIEGNLTASRKYSPMGRAMRNRLGFHVVRVNENHFQIAFKTNTESFSGPRFAAYLEPIAKQKARRLADYDHLFDFLPREDETSVTEFSFNANETVKVLLHEPYFSLSIVRDEKDVLLSTSRGPLIMTDNYWELTLYLASGSSLQGLGGLELNATTNWIYNNENQTIRPVFLALQSNVACSLDYQGPLEVQVLNGSNLVILRGISIPDTLTINLYTASTPLKTIQQFSSTNNPQVLSSKRLGLHLCPDHYDNLSSALDSLKKLLESPSKDVAPWDSHCLSRRHLGLTLEHDSELSLVAEARKILTGRTLAAHLTPMLLDRVKGPLQSSLEEESRLLGNGTRSYVGMYDKQGVVYPDWTEEKTREIAREYMGNYTRDLKLGFIVLRDSWPRDEIQHNASSKSFDYLPEQLQRLMSNGSIPFDLKNHYTTHNAYASSFANFVGSKGVELRGHECNSPNIEVSWSSLRSILEIGMIEAMTGRVPTAMYVCGANRVRINDELCVRWYALSVALPRILAVPEKSPFLGTRLSRTSASQVAKLLKLRAILTAYHRATMASFIKESTPILSATGVYFPDDRQPRNTSQFLWGDSILVGLVMLPRRYQVPMWLPGEHPWRHFHGGSPVGPSINGSSIPVSVAMGEVVLLVRPGRIIPVHREAGGSSVETSLKNLYLLANPICDSSSICQADGRIYFSDDDDDDEVNGEFLLISYFNKTLALSNVLEVKKVACEALATHTSILESFQILGATSYPIDLDICKLQGDDSVELKDI